MSKEMTDEEFHHHIVDGLLNELYDKPLLNEFLFYEIPKNIKSDVFRYLIGEINDITRIEKDSNVLLSVRYMNILWDAMKARLVNWVLILRIVIWLIL